MACAASLNDKTGEDNSSRGRIVTREDGHSVEQLLFIALEQFCLIGDGAPSDENETCYQ